MTEAGRHSTPGTLTEMGITRRQVAAYALAFVVSIGGVEYAAHQDDAPSLITVNSQLVDSTSIPTAPVLPTSTKP